MLNKKSYLAPDIEFEPMSLQSVICESGDTEDYNVIDDFVW